MSRTVVPPPPPPSTGAPPGTLRGDAGDDLPTKLVKYVPAETLAFFVPAAAALGPGRNEVLIAILVVGIVGTVGWLWYRGSTEPVDKRPLPHFYALAAVAFVVWALATAPNVTAMLGLDVLVAGIILAAAVFLIPLADGVLNRLLAGR